MDLRMTQTLLMDALIAAYWKKQPTPGLMHHSEATNTTVMLTMY